jgi:hypothetical protein
VVDCQRGDGLAMESDVSAEAGAGDGEIVGVLEASLDIFGHSFSVSKNIERVLDWRRTDKKCYSL